ncbi:hypothetical protein DFAR_750001 [Desulfarculales bacterium]
MRTGRRNDPGAYLSLANGVAQRLSWAVYATHHPLSPTAYPYSAC